jgi:hypothetical protein
VLCRSADPYEDATLWAHCTPLADSQLHTHTEALTRDELVEVDRLSAFFNVVTTALSSGEGEGRTVFYYSWHLGGVAAIWNAISSLEFMH